MILESDHFNNKIACVHFSGSMFQADWRKSGGDFSAARNIFRKGFASGENANSFHS